MKINIPVFHQHIDTTELEISNPAKGFDREQLRKVHIFAAFLDPKINRIKGVISEYSISVNFYQDDTYLYSIQNLELNGEKFMVELLHNTKRRSKKREFNYHPFGMSGSIDYAAFIKEICKVLK